MISSQSVPLLAILASSLTLTCLSLIKSTLYPNLVIFISETSVEFVIFFLFLQPLLLQIHLFPANLTIAIHFTLASHKQIVNKLQRIQNSLARVITNTSKYQHITPTLKKLHWLPIKQRIDYKTCLLTYKTLTNQQPTYLYNSLSFPSAFCFYTIFWFACSFHSICPIITWQKGFLCHRSTPLEFTPPWYPKLIFSTNIPFQTQNTPLQNCVPSLGSFLSPWTVYPDFDSCYSHFMPYRMTPSVRHRGYGSSLLIIIIIYYNNRANYIHDRDKMIEHCFNEMCWAATTDK